MAAGAQDGSALVNYGPNGAQINHINAVRTLQTMGLTKGTHQAEAGDGWIAVRLPLPEVANE